MDTPLDQVSDAAETGLPCPLDPMPSADPLLVAAWLRRLRLGAILGAVGVLVWGTISFIVGYWVVIGGWVGQFVTPWAAILVHAASVWLLTSPEPGNRRWFWYLRWALRVGTVAAGLITGLSTLGFPGEADQATGRAKMIIVVLQCGLSVCYFAYMSAVARRLGDETLRKCFKVLAWLMVGFLVLMVLLLVHKHFAGPAPNGSATRPAVATETQEPRKTGSLFGNMCFAVWGLWMVWLHWRLARRLRAAANQFADLSLKG